MPCANAHEIRSAMCLPPAAPTFPRRVAFEVRYWSLPALQKLFASQIGPTTFSVDCFFGIGLQFSDLRFMTPLLKVVVTVSEGLRLLSRVVTPLIRIADSVYVTSVKDNAAPTTCSSQAGGFAAQVTTIESLADREGMGHTARR